MQMQHEHDRRQHRRRDHDRERDPRDPLARPQVQLAPPVFAFQRGVDDDLRVGNDALHVDVVLVRVLRRPHEEVLDVVVRAAEAKICVRC